jgi:hypothetical protein
MYLNLITVKKGEERKGRNYDKMAKREKSTGERSEESKGNKIYMGPNK